MNLLIAGATARAAAFSALRAGLVPVAFDRFADRDLVDVATVHRLPEDGDPAAIADAFADAPSGPWLYTGPWENRPERIARLEAVRPLWGNGSAVLRRVRDPLAVADALREMGRPHPEVRLDPHPPPRDGTWLRKPIASAGGHGVVVWDHATPPTRRASYYQRFVPGEPLSALFVGTRTRAAFMGVTRQLIGLPGAPFAYRGTVAPWPVPARDLDAIIELGEMLAGRFGLVGLFGIDLVRDDDGPWLVEINPRYTAAVEVIELATGRALLTEHRAACEGRVPTPMGPASRVVGKEIVFAETGGVFQTGERSLPAFEPFAVPDWADVPHEGATVEAGAPLLTVFAEGPTAEDCLRALARAIEANGPSLYLGGSPV